jgi:hypothetical protein
MRARRVPASVAPLHAFVRRRRRLSWFQALDLGATMTGVVVLVGEQSTMLLLDPARNALEFKAFADDSQVFAT